MGAPYNLGHVQYNSTTTERGRGRKMERRGGRARQSIAVPTNGADKYLIGMYYELVITLHNGAAL